jgi:hypothetical protein
VADFCPIPGGQERFKIERMADAYEVWIGEVQQSLGSINISMDDRQSLWSFDFRAEYKVGTKLMMRQ